MTVSARVVLGSRPIATCNWAAAEVSPQWTALPAGMLWQVTVSVLSCQLLAGVEIACGLEACLAWYCSECWHYLLLQR